MNVVAFVNPHYFTTLCQSKRVLPNCHAFYIWSQRWIKALPF